MGSVLGEARRVVPGAEDEGASPAAARIASTAAHGSVARSCHSASVSTSCTRNARRMRVASAAEVAVSTRTPASPSASPRAAARSGSSSTTRIVSRVAMAFPLVQAHRK